MKQNNWFMNSTWLLPYHGDISKYKYGIFSCASKCRVSITISLLPLLYLRLTFVVIINIDHLIISCYMSPNWDVSTLK